MLLAGNRGHGVENVDIDQTGQRRRRKTALSCLLVLIALWGCWGAHSYVDLEIARGAGSGFCSEPALAIDQSSPFRVRLSTSAAVVAPRGKLKIRVENLGREHVAYGLAYRLARFRKGVWINLPTGPFFAPRKTLASGRAGECQVIHIGPDAQPGRYRIVKRISPMEIHERRARNVRAFFRVR